MKRKMICILAAALGAMQLAACGGSASQTEVVTEQAGEQADAQEQAEDQEQAEENSDVIGGADESTSIWVADSADTAEDTQVDAQIYANASITLQYPVGWTVQEQAGEDGTTVGFLAEDGTEVLNFRQSEAWVINLEATESEYQELLAAEYDSPELSGVEKTTLGGYDAVQVNFSYLQGEREYAAVKYYVVADLVGFEFTYNYAKDAEDSYADAVAELLASVSFTVE